MDFSYWHYLLVIFLIASVAYSARENTRSLEKHLTFIAELLKQVRDELHEARVQQDELFRPNMNSDELPPEKSE